MTLVLDHSAILIDYCVVRRALVMLGIMGSLSILKSDLIVIIQLRLKNQSLRTAIVLRGPDAAGAVLRVDAVCDNRAGVSIVRARARLTLQYDKRSQDLVERVSRRVGVRHVRAGRRGAPVTFVYTPHSSPPVVHVHLPEDQHR